MRVVAIRGLPDQPGDKHYPREEWIDQGKPVQLAPEEEEKRREERGATKEDQSGDYAVSGATLNSFPLSAQATLTRVMKNIEIALSYQGKPGEKGSQLRTSNIHLMLEFFLGL